MIEEGVGKREGESNRGTNLLARVNLVRPRADVGDYPGVYRG